MVQLILNLENEHLHVGHTKFLNTGSMCPMKFFVIFIFNLKFVCAAYKLTKQNFSNLAVLSYAGNVESCGAYRRHSLVYAQNKMIICAGFNSQILHAYS